MAGLHAATSGTLGEGGRVTEGRVEMTAEQVAPIRPFLPPEMARLAPLLQGPANLLVLIAGPPEALAMRATLDLGDLRAEMQPVLNVPARRWVGPVALHHPGAIRLLTQLGFGGTASWLGDGSFSIIAQIAKVPGRLDIGSLDLVAGAMRIGGQLSISDRTAQGRLRAETLPLPSIDPRSPDPLPIAALGTIAASLHVEAANVLVALAPAVTNLVTDLDVRNGGLSLTDLSARAAGGTIAGSAKLEPGDLPHFSLQGRADGIVLPEPLLGGTLDVAAGTLTMNATLAGDGFSPAALTATLGGTGAVTVQNAAVTGFELSAAQAALADPDTAHLLPTLRAALLAGNTNFPLLDIPFEARRGIVTLHASGAAAPGSATLNGTVDLLSGTLEGRLTLLPGPDLPDLPVRLSGHVTNPVRTPELAGAARWLAERP